MRIRRALLAPVLFLAVACAAVGGGPTDAFAEAPPRTVFVLAPAREGIGGAAAEGVRTALMQALRRKGYGVTTAAEARLIPVVERWGGAPDGVALSARLVDREDRLLWSDHGRAGAEGDTERSPGSLAEAAVANLLRSLPDAARR